MSDKKKNIVFLFLLAQVRFSKVSNEQFLFIEILCAKMFGSLYFDLPFCVKNVKRVKSVKLIIRNQLHFLRFKSRLNQFCKIYKLKFPSVRHFFKIFGNLLSWFLSLFLSFRLSLLSLSREFFHSFLSLIIIYSHRCSCCCCCFAKKSHCSLSE